MSPSPDHLILQIQALEVRIGDMCKAIKVLEDEVHELKNVNKCERCDYKANSSTCLKTHMGKKHRDLVPHPAPERERAAPTDTNLNILMPGEGRDVCVQYIYEIKKSRFAKSAQK